MIPATLYQLAGAPEDAPPEMVRAAALVETTAPPSLARSAAIDVLSNPEARGAYDARAAHGLSFELALAWGVAALATGDVARARAHWERADRTAPDNAAVAALLGAAEQVPEGPPDIAPETRHTARREADRLGKNSAFPHRLIRYVEALANATPEAGEDGDLLAGAARELLQYDVVEAPRAYTMILPVLRQHYPAAYALDDAFFDATLAVLTAQTRRAETERGRAENRAAPSEDLRLPPPPRPAPGGRDLPPLNIPNRRLELPALPKPGGAWLGAVFGALFGARGGPRLMLVGAALGFAIAYLFIWSNARKT